MDHINDVSIMNSITRSFIIFIVIVKDIIFTKNHAIMVLSICIWFCGIVPFSLILKEVHDIRINQLQNSIAGGFCFVSNVKIKDDDKQCYIVSLRRCCNDHNQKDKLGK